MNDPADRSPLGVSRVPGEVLMRGLANAIGLPGLLLMLVGCQSTPAWMNASLVSLPSATSEKDELPPDQAVQACLAVARNLEKNGDEIAALQQYERVARIEPDNLEVMRRLAVLYDRASEWAKADAQYTKLTQARPRDADLFNDWGYSYYERTNWKEAEGKLRRALELNPKHSRAQCNLGLVLGQQERYDEALKAFAAVVSEADAHSNLAFIYWTRGKLDEARRECLTARQLDPACTKAQDILAALDKPRSPPPEANPAPGARRNRAARATVLADPALRELNLQPGQLPPDLAPAGADGAALQPVYRSPSGTAWVPVKPQAAPSETPADAAIQ